MTEEKEIRNNDDYQPPAGVEPTEDADPFILHQFFYFIVFQVIAPDQKEYIQKFGGSREVTIPGRTMIQNGQVMIPHPIHIDAIRQMEAELAEKFTVADERHPSMTVVGAKTRVVITDFKLMGRRSLRKSEVEAEIAAQEEAKKVAEAAMQEADNPPDNPDGMIRSEER